MTEHKKHVPSDEVIRRDFETGTVQPGPGMAPDRPPAQDELEAARASKSGTLNKAGAADQKGSSGSCGCS